MGNARAIRVPCGNAKCAARKGKRGVTNKDGAQCCCGGDQKPCDFMYKAVPCHAGEVFDTICGCAAGYPSKPIWVCTDAKLADGGRMDLYQVIRAKYGDNTDDAVCFTVLNGAGDSIYDSSTIPKDATVIHGPLDGVGSCESPICKDIGARFVIPRNCGYGNQAVRWVCAAWVDGQENPCETYASSNYDTCVSFLGPLFGQRFKECPGSLFQFDTGNLYTDCCDCVSRIGGPCGEGHEILYAYGECGRPGYVCAPSWDCYTDHDCGCCGNVLLHDYYRREESIYPWGNIVETIECKCRSCADEVTVTIKHIDGTTTSSKRSCCSDYWPRCTPFGRPCAPDIPADAKSGGATIDYGCNVYEYKSEYTRTAGDHDETYKFEEHSFLTRNVPAFCEGPNCHGQPPGGPGSAGRSVASGELF